MKKLFALAFVAGTFALVSCGGSSETATAVDSVATEVVDSVAVVAPVDTVAAIVDSAAAKVEEVVK